MRAAAVIVNFNGGRDLERCLAALAAQLDAPVYADRYQLTALLRFYQPGLAATQWPGISRPSEYLLGQIAPRMDPRAEAGPFWLITTRPDPPDLQGFRPTQQRTLYDCAGAPLAEGGPPPCTRPLHRWNLFRYQAP